MLHRNPLYPPAEFTPKASTLFSQASTRTLFWVPLMLFCKLSPPFSHSFSGSPCSVLQFVDNGLFFFFARTIGVF